MAYAPSWLEEWLAISLEELWHTAIDFSLRMELLDLCSNQLGLDLAVVPCTVSQAPEKLKARAFSGVERCCIVVQMTG